MNSRKQIRVELAKERQEAYNKLSTKQKITALDLMFGEGKGATKQRAKLQLRLLNEVVTPEVSKKLVDDKQKKPYQKPKKS